MSQLSYLCTLHRFKQSWRLCRPYLLPCLVVAIFGLATGAFCIVYMPETLPEAQVQRSSELLPKWLQPRSDYQALMSDEAESPLMRVKQRRPPRPSKHTAERFVLGGTAMLRAGAEMRRLSKQASGPCLSGHVGQAAMTGWELAQHVQHLFGCEPSALRTEPKQVTVSMVVFYGFLLKLPKLAPSLQA